MLSGAPFSTVGRARAPCAKALQWTLVRLPAWVPLLRVTPPLSPPVSCHIFSWPINKAIKSQKNILKNYFSRGWNNHIHFMDVIWKKAPWPTPCSLALTVETNSLGWCSFWNKCFYCITKMLSSLINHKIIRLGRYNKASKNSTNAKVY